MQNYSIKYLLILFFIFFLVPRPLLSQFYNGSQLTFGKNRVQYDEFFWTYYQFEKFDTYFYLNGMELAQYTARYAETQLEGIEEKLDSKLEDKIQFIIFNKLSELKQSNLGLLSEDSYNTGGITHIIGRKVFLYFDGSYDNYNKQIRAGIANVLVNQMMYGGKIFSQMKNSAIMVLPDWYVNGLVDYLSEDWNTEIENYVKDGILSGKYEKFNHLTGTDAVYAGHSIWNFIAEKYGKSHIPNIIYMTKISRNVESGFLFVLGISFKNLIKEWMDYYKQRFMESAQKRTLPDEGSLLKRYKSSRVYSNLKISPDGKYAAYTTNELGQYKVWLYDLEKNKAKKIKKSGYKLDEKTDHSYPLLAWHPTSDLLAIIVEKKGEILLYYYTIKKKKFSKIILHNFDKIIDFAYSHNAKYFVLSAVQKGQSDIFIYNIAAGSYEQITKDRFDDLNPRFINYSKGIIFSSNRINDTITFEQESSFRKASDTYDLFLYDNSRKSSILRRVTNTELANELKPVEYEDGYISYLSDNNGIYNRYVAHFDSTIAYIDTTTHYRHFTNSYPVTNYSRNILDHDISSQSRTYGEIIFHNGIYEMFANTLIPVKNIEKTEPEDTEYFKDLNQKLLKEQSDTIKESPPKPPQPRKRFINVYENDAEASEDSTKQSNKIDINNYSFEKQAYSEGQTKREVDNAQEKTSTDSIESDKSNDFIIPKRLNYNVEYFINEIVTQVDFSFLNSTYQSFTGGGSPIFLNPGLNGLFKIGITDLLEDYRITGGVRLSVNLDNNEYILSFSNLKHRLDREIVFHRQSMETVQSYSIIKFRSHELYYMLKWPFDNVISIRGTAILRNDRSIFLSTDEFNLKEPDIVKNWAGVKGELVYDATRNIGLNLYYGTRFKVFAEYYQQINKENNNLIVVGLDYRKYTKIHRTLIWANRIAASTSFGNNRLIYYMGGVDNWLFPKFNNSVPVATDQGYAYQTLATNMRGFDQNIRNGNSFFVFNTEIRFPVFRYLANRPLRSDLLNNFQVVGFGDIGTAWTGPDPYSRENSLYTRVIHQNPITITLENQVEPIVGGFGFGLRTRLLGYFIRADWAWGVEDYEVRKKSVFYLSLSLDF